MCVGVCGGVYFCTFFFTYFSSLSTWFLGVEMVVILHRTPGNRLFVYIMFKLGVTEKFECFGVDVIWEGGVFLLLTEMKSI